LPGRTGTPANGAVDVHHRNAWGTALLEDEVHLEEEAGIGLHRFTVRSHAHRPTIVEVAMGRSVG
jgi:hypothetical protein